MESFLTAARAVYPMLAMILTGMLVRKLGMVTDGGLREMNRLVYTVFLPALMFVNVMDSDFSAGVDWAFFVWPLVMIGVVFIVLMLAVPLLEKRADRRGVLVQAVFRSNFMVFGLAIVTSLYGSGRMGPIVLLAAVAVPLMNALSVVALAFFRGGRPEWRTIGLNVLKNPVIIATALAFAFRGLGIYPLPEVFYGFSKVATPFALVVIGASFTFQSVADFRPQLLWGVLGKLVLVPAAVLPVFIALGFRYEMLVALMAIFGGPSAASSFAMAQQMGGDVRLAASMVVFTSTLSAASFFLWIFLLGTLGLI